MFGYSRVSASCCRLTVRWPRWSLRSGSRRLLPTVGTASGSILALRPVTFHYKSDTKGIPQFGLIAGKSRNGEPSLGAAQQTRGKPYTMRYDAVNAMLLNEFLKANRKMRE